MGESTSLTRLGEGEGVSSSSVNNTASAVYPRGKGDRERRQGEGVKERKKEKLIR